MNRTIKLSIVAMLTLSTTLIAEEKLEDITVTSASKTDQNINDVTSNVAVITAQEIKERHYTTVMEALNSLPGVSFTQNGGLGTTASLRLRGFDNQKVLVLIDGIRYNDISNSSGAIFSDILASDIETIEVLKGAQSGVWGADAAAGVISIITKGAKEGLNFHASQEFGSFNTSKTEVASSYRGDNFYIKASQNRVISDGFSAQAPEGEDLDKFEDDAYRNITSNLKAGFNINATNRVDITHTVVDTETEYDQNIYDGTYPNSVLNRVKSANSEASSSNKSKFYSINFNHIDSFNEIDIYAKKSTFEREYPDEFTKKYEGEVKEYGLKSKVPYLDDSFLLLGGDYKKFNDKAGVNQSFTNRAIFLTNYNKVAGLLGGKTILTESLRYDKYNEFDNKTTGKIGLKHLVGNIEGLSASANYGTAYNVPSSFQLYSSYGNPNMKPEVTKGYDVTLSYRDLSLTYFNNEIEDIIDYDYATNKYANIDGKSKIKGFEVAYNTSLFDTVALNLGYSRLDAKDVKGKDLKRRADQSLKFGVDYYGIENLHLGLNGEYVGERKDTNFDTYEEVETGKYPIANFTANYELDRHMTIYGKVENITDREYQTVYGYASAPIAAYAGMRLTY